MTDVSPKIILRIAKLKRLSAGSSGPEAETAAASAARLEAKYGVTVNVEDLDDYIQDAESKSSFEERWIHVFSYEVRHQHAWRQFLLQQLAPLYECITFPKEDDAVELVFLWVGGPPDQLSICVAHFDWICYRVETVSLECNWDNLSAEAMRGVRWGALDRLLRNMTAWGPGAPTQAETQTITEAGGMLEGYVNPASLVPTRGLVRVGGPGDVRAGARPAIDVEPPPLWAYRRGYRGAELEKAKPPLILMQPVAALPGLDHSTTSILERMGYQTVADLVRARPAELQAHRGIGKGRLRRIRTALENLGLQLMADWGATVSDAADTSSRPEGTHSSRPQAEKKRSRSDRVRSRGRPPR